MCFFVIGIFSNLGLSLSYAQRNAECKMQNAGFSIYVNSLHTYNFVYGTIGAFAVLLVWLYYSSILILVGAEINSQVYNRLEITANVK